MVLREVGRGVSRFAKELNRRVKKFHNFSKINQSKLPEFFNITIPTLGLKLASLEPGQVQIEIEFLGPVDEAAQALCGPDGDGRLRTHEQSPLQISAVDFLRLIFGPVGHNVFQQLLAVIPSVRWQPTVQ